MNLIDTHAHLTWECFKEDLDQVVDRAATSGVETVINIGADLESSYEAAKFECPEIKCYSTVGLHPDESLKLLTDVSIQQNIGELEKIYHCHPDKVVAVGECGLDYFAEGLGNLGKLKEYQKELFKAQISLAKKINLPLIIHCREAWEDLPWDDLKSLPVVFHYFTGPQDIAQRILELGFYLSFSCVVTYPKNEALREIIKTTPLDKILAETDSPFSPPQIKRGQRNEPANVSEVVKTITKVKNLSFEEVAQKTFENAIKLFNLE